MRHLFRKHAILLAALLQVLPVVRTLVTNPAATSTFAIILRWTIGSTAALGAFDACSGATNSFATPTNLTGTVNILYTNSLTLSAATAGDGGALCTVSSSTATNVLSNGQTTTNSMPAGLTFKFIDRNSGTASFTNVYCPIYGTPTQPGTNTFKVYLLYSGASPISNVFTISILAAASSPPVITNQPVSLTNLVGSIATFSTIAGTPPLAYQWRFNTNTTLSGATNFSLSLTNVQLTNAGYYNVVITNSSGSVTSAPALLTVWQPPSITNNPVGLTNVAGGSASFSVIAGGVPAVAYQWRLLLATVPSASAATLSLTNLRVSQAGGYTVVITNSAGSVTSSIATLVVTNPLPPGISSSARISGGFQFTFVPVAGLTNSVQTNNVLNGGVWSVLTNVPPPANTSPVTITDAINATNRFYRIQIIP